MHRIKDTWERGQSLVELAFGLTVLIILLGGLFDLGRAFLILITVENAAGEGALFAVTHVECLAPDHAAGTCEGTESVEGRVTAEGEPVITILEENVDLFVEDGGTAFTIASSDDIVAGRTLRVDVTYHYQPVTPVGFWLWGSMATVNVTSRQEILSPVPPGHDY